MLKRQKACESGFLGSLRWLFFYGLACGWGGQKSFAGLKLFDLGLHLPLQTSETLLALQASVTLSAAETAQLVRRAWQGNRPAVNRLVEAWYPRIYNFAYRYFFDHDQAGEATQQTFIRMHQRLAQLEDPDRFRAWLYQIAHNQCHEQHRQLRRQPDPIGEQWAATASTAEPAHNPEAAYGQAELSALLQQALNSLPESQRAIVIMKEYEGLKFREIAEALGLPENTVKSRLYYGLKHLRKTLREWQITPETLHV